MVVLYNISELLYNVNIQIIIFDELAICDSIDFEKGL